MCPPYWTISVYHPSKETHFCLFYQDFILSVSHVLSAARLLLSRCAYRGFVVFERLTNTWCNPQTGRKVRKDGIPDRRFAIHVQKNAFHPIGERGLGQAIKLFKGRHHTADHGRGITALHKRDKAHARISQDGDKAIEFVVFAFLLVMECSPIVLHLLTRLGFIALDWILSYFCGT